MKTNGLVFGSIGLERVRPVSLAVGTIDLPMSDAVWRCLLFFFTNYLELKFPPSLRAFTAQCAELLGILETLEPKAWSRSARVTGAGKVLERTVQAYAESLAVHERPHLKQIKRIAEAMHS